MPPSRPRPHRRISAHVLVRDVQQPGLRAEAHGLPVLGAGGGRADVGHGLSELREFLIIVDEPARFQVDAF